MLRHLQLQKTPARSGKPAESNFLDDESILVLYSHSKLGYTLVIHWLFLVGVYIGVVPFYPYLQINLQGDSISCRYAQLPGWNLVTALGPKDLDPTCTCDLLCVQHMGLSKNCWVPVHAKMLLNTVQVWIFCRGMLYKSHRLRPASMQSCDDFVGLQNQCWWVPNFLHGRTHLNGLLIVLHTRAPGQRFHLEDSCNDHNNSHHRVDVHPRLCANIPIKCVHVEQTA